MMLHSSSTLRPTQRHRPPWHQWGAAKEVRRNMSDGLAAYFDFLRGKAQTAAQGSPEPRKGGAKWVMN